MKFNNPWHALYCLSLCCVFACQHASVSAGSDVTFTSQSHHAVRICADGETVRGIDVSTHQGDIDWEAVAADGVKFAFIRVSDGVDYLDDYFYQNWEEAGRVGLIRGAYQYFRSGDDVAAQAQILLERMGDLGPGILPPVIDIENLDNGSEALLWASVLEWIEIIEQATGVKPILYTYPYFWQTHSTQGPWSDHLLWIANYDVNCPDVPDDWDNWTFFQYSSTGSVAGIDGNVDLNYFNGSYQELEALAGPVAPCPRISDSGATIEVTSRCFRLDGPRRYWRREEGGYDDGHYYWTHATDNAEAVNSARWRLDFEVSGRYDIEIHSAAGAAETQQAPYTIQAGSDVISVTVDQSVVSGWSSLGRYDFAAGAEQWVRVDDNSGEPNADDIRIVADAIRIVPVNPTLPDTGMENDAGVEASDMMEPAPLLDSGRVLTGDGSLASDQDDMMIDDEGDDDTVLGSGGSAAVRAEGSSGCSTTLGSTPHGLSLMMLLLLCGGSFRIQRSHF